MGKHPRYERMDPENPDALARCDYSGFLVARRDLVKQMEYRGNGLIWNGFWVGKRFADKPNPQLLNPVLAPDPPALVNPGARPDSNTATSFFAVKDMPAGNFWDDHTFVQASVGTDGQPVLWMWGAT